MTSRSPRCLVRLLTGLVLSVLALGSASGLLARPAGAQEDPSSTVDRDATPGRMLVVSMPGLTWSDFERHDLPALESFMEEAAVADLAPRSVVARSGAGDAYLTISGGSRAATDGSVDGQVLGLEEQSAGSEAGEIYTRRTGTEPDGPFVSLTWPTLQRVNDAQPYGTELGSLTEALEAADVSAAAIGNADGVDAVADSYERQVGLALADSTGVVPAGKLDKGLLVADPDVAYGLRLDHDQVLAAFDQAWSDAEPSDSSSGGVVLVEGSDLARTLSYRPLVEQDRYDQMWGDALEDTDRLFGELMDSVDLSKDTVMVVAPYNLRRDRDLTAVALAGPGIEPGYLRSASTQRPGFLTLVDIGPTILDRFDLTRPVEMEGRPAVAVASQATSAERIDHLVALNRASRFREQLLVPTTTAIVVGFALVVALAIAAHANRWGTRARGAISFGGLVVLALMPMSYLARVFTLEELGTGFYWGFILATAVLLVGVSTLLAHLRGSTRAPLIVVLAAMALVLIGDVTSGSHLSLSAAFGYSATGNSRLYGISNYSYGQLASATCIVAAWLAAARPGRTGRILGVAAMMVTLVVLGVPIWGSDVGGVLAFTPAVAAFVVKITERKIRLRTIVAGVGATAAAILVFGFLDLARAPSNRGHLGRLFERVGAEGIGPLLSMMQRKLTANLEVSTSSTWVLAIPIGIAFWVFLARFPDRPYRRLVGRFTTLPAGLLAALVAGVLGSALNDSGAIIGGIMALVVGMAMAILLVEGPAPADPVLPDGGEGSDASEPGSPEPGDDGDDDVPEQAAPAPVLAGGA